MMGGTLSCSSFSLRRYISFSFSSLRYVHMIVEGDDVMNNGGMMGWGWGVGGGGWGEGGGGCLPVAALVSHLGGTFPPLSLL